MQLKTMKIKVKNSSYDKVLALPKEKPFVPRRPSGFFRALINVISAGELRKVRFKYISKGMDALDKKQPCLYLMNHSSFLDLKIAEKIIPQPFNIVTTSDAFVGQKWLLRTLGCIPTTKFVTDTTLVRQMLYCFNKLKTSVLMYPEASYSFDGTATTLPEGLGKCLKLFNVPVVMITTYGDFLYDPLYNGLQTRKVDVSATMEYVLSSQQIKDASVAELNAELNRLFSFDNFRYQQEKGVVIDEPFRADYLHRVLYKCPHCGAEGSTVGKGTTLSCNCCGKTYELTDRGYMKALDGDTEFTHIPDWYRWQRECVRQEIKDGAYLLDTEVDVIVMKDTKAVYRIGSGRLTHDINGFHLVADDGLDYIHPSKLSYSIYADYLWYEIGDVICIGTNEILYYCIPRDGAPVAKARLAAEEIYKIIKAKS